ARSAASPWRRFPRTHRPAAPLERSAPRALRSSSTPLLEHSAPRALRSSSTPLLERSAPQALRPRALRSSSAPLPEHSAPRAARDDVLAPRPRGRVPLARPQPGQPGHESGTNPVHARSATMTVVGAPSWVAAPYWRPMSARTRLRWAWWLLAYAILGLGTLRSEEHTSELPSRDKLV